MSFPEIGLTNAPEIEITTTHWMSFPEIGLCHVPEYLKYHFTLNALFWMSFQKNRPVSCPKILKLTIG